MAEQRLRWHRLAIEDLEEGHAFLASESPEAARRWAQQILDAAERLLDFPELGKALPDLEPPDRYRAWICGHYRLIYRYDDSVISILRVWDDRRNPSRLSVDS